MEPLIIPSLRFLSPSFDPAHPPGLFPGFTPPPDPTPPLSQGVPWGAAVLGLAGLLADPSGAQATIALGETCPTVAQVQITLAELGYRPGALDGVFGEATHEAVVRFQGDRGIQVDGVVGPETAAQLNLSQGEAVASGQGGCSIDSASDPAWDPALRAAASGDTSAPLPEESAGSPGEFYEVVVDALNVRSHPNLEAPIVSVLYRGDVVQGMADGGAAPGWIALVTGDWIAGDYVQLRGDRGPASPFNDHPFIASEPEASPSLDAPQPDQQPHSPDPLPHEFMEEPATPEATPGGLGDGEFQAAPAFVQVNTPVLNVRSGPGYSYPVLGTYPAGEVLETAGIMTPEGWIQLASGEWVSGVYVMPLEGDMDPSTTLETLDAQGNPSPDVGGQIWATVSTLGGDLWVRSSPGGAVVGSLPNGSPVALSGMAQDGWVQLQDGQWVAGDYLGGYL